ncbi:hypothetical protein BDC45DRAFT_494612 [Circinella umbellata]|nr:hypothetical protein BDC45DRAFT_494612 [Circinella umbellata]
MPYENPYVIFYGYYNEVAPAYFNAEIGRYDKFTLDIGWAMRSVHSNRRIKKGTCRHYKKICNGFVTCKAYALYFFEGSTCTTEHHVEHNHNQINDNDDGTNNQLEKSFNYPDKHLSYKQQQQLDVYLGIDKKDSEPEGFEAAPLSIRKDLFADFEGFEQEYSHFFTSANITSDCLLPRSGHG